MEPEHLYHGPQDLAYATYQSRLAGPSDACNEEHPFLAIDYPLRKLLAQLLPTREDRMWDGHDNRPTYLVLIYLGNAFERYYLCHDIANTRRSPVVEFRAESSEDRVS